MQVQGTRGNVGDLINMGAYHWTYDAARYQKRATDELLSKMAPTSEKPVGEFYTDFRQVTDDEVRQLLGT